MRNEYLVPKQNLEKVLDKIDKLNKKAEKLGAESIRVDVSREPEEEIIQDDGSILEKHKVVVEGEEPKLEGWEFIASLEMRHDVGKNLINSSPSVDSIPEEFKESYRCDHCKTNRYRKYTYLIYKEGEGYKQVGSTCLKDFLGGNSPHKMVKFFEYFDELDENIISYGNGKGIDDWDYDLEEYLGYVAEAMERFGWTSKSKARKIYEEEGREVKSTADIAWRSMNGAMNYDPKYDIDSVSDKSKELSKKVVDWIENKEEGECDSEYMYNLWLIGQVGRFKSKSTGLVGSMIIAYKRDNNLFKNNKKKRKKSEYVGEEGERLNEIKLNLEKRVDIEIEDRYRGGYKLLSIHIFKDKEGNKLVWKTTSRRLDEDCEYVINGTVKEHEKYRGGKQTVLSRCYIHNKIVNDKVS